MHYSPVYGDTDEDDRYDVSEAINSGLSAVNQTEDSWFLQSQSSSSIPSPNSVYDDRVIYGADDTDVMWYGADFGKPKPQFSDAEQKLMNEVLELEEAYPYVRYNIPSPATLSWSQFIPTSVERAESPPPSPPAEFAAHPQTSNSVGGVRRRRRQRQRQLWQFLLEILCDDEYSPSIIEWVRREDGVFRFVNPRSVAELWGRRRRRQTMTYEHLSRAMRYYYRRGVMKRVVDLGRLVYQFLSNAEGWRDAVRRGDGKCLTGK